MKKAIIAKKLGMTQVFDEKGNVVPVTVIEAGPCPVIFLKTLENDGYEAVQLGFGDIRVKKVNKPMAGHFAKQGVAPRRYLREFKLGSDLKVGDILKADVFASGDRVDVVGTSKGKGTAGVVKRWHYSKLKESHGSGPVGRHGGSIGACSSPSRVYKGKKMAGRLGHERVTVQNLAVVQVDAEHNLLAIRGAIPGPKGGIVLVSSSIKKAKAAARP